MSCPDVGGLQVIACEQGRIPIDQVFGKEAQSLVAHLNVEGHHRGAVAAAINLAKLEKEHKEHEALQHHDDEHGHKHEHGHEHQHGAEEDCPACKEGALRVLGHLTGDAVEGVSVLWGGGELGGTGLVTLGRRAPGGWGGIKTVILILLGCTQPLMLVVFPAKG